MSFDRYGAKQELNLIGVNDKDDRFAGLSITDSKPGEIKTPNRIWLGRCIIAKRTVWLSCRLDTCSPDSPWEKSSSVRRNNNRAGNWYPDSSSIKHCSDQLEISV